MARRLQIVAPCRSKQRNNFADVCVLHDFRRHQRKQTAYGRINTDKVDGCLKRLTRVMLKLERRILLFFSKGLTCTREVVLLAPRATPRLFFFSF